MDDEHDAGLFRDDEEDEQDGDHIFDSDVGRELLAYLIDAGLDMFLPYGNEDDANGETYFDAVVKCITKDMKTRIISRDKDEVVICFFNTREKRNFQESDGVFVFQSSEQDTLQRHVDEPCQPTAKLIKDFSHIKEVFEKKIGSKASFTLGSRDNPLYNALWVAQGLLRKGSVKNSSKRILLFTNNDDPFGDADTLFKADMRRVTVQRARDAQDLGISIELFPLSRPREEFNVSIFYADILGLDDQERSNFMVAAAERFEDLINRLQKRMFKKRAVRRLTLTISNGMNIAVQSFALLRTSMPGPNAWLDSSTNKLLKSESSFVCSDTGALVSEPLQRFQVYKGKKVLFSPKEISEVKKVTDVQLQLLGFKSLQYLRDYHNLQPATFLYPDEERINGSTSAFIGLFRAMLRLKKFAVAFFSQSTSSRVVALVAQEEISNEIGQVEPPGMYMIYLPYSDDIRHVEKLQSSTDGPIPRATDEQIQKAIAMMRRIDLKGFSFEHYPNPALQKHYAVLEALALQEDDLPDVKDYTMPDETRMKRPAIVEAVKAFKDAVYGPDHDFLEEAAAAEKAKGTPASQKRKAAEEAASKDYEKYNWDELADTGKLKELTQNELRLYLVKHKLQITGKKDVVVNRILTHLGK